MTRALRLLPVLFLFSGAAAAFECPAMGIMEATRSLTTLVNTPTGAPAVRSESSMVSASEYVLWKSD